MKSRDEAANPAEGEVAGAIAILQTAFKKSWPLQVQAATRCHRPRGGVGLAWVTVFLLRVAELV